MVQSAQAFQTSRAGDKLKDKGQLSMNPTGSLTSSTWTGGPFVRAGLGWAFRRGLRLRADALWRCS